MAQIPRYTQQIGGLGAANIPKQSMDVPADAFGAGQGRQLSQFGAAMQDTAGIFKRIEEAQERMRKEKQAAEIADAKLAYLQAKHDYEANENYPLTYKGAQAYNTYGDMEAGTKTLTTEQRGLLADKGWDDEGWQEYDNFVALQNLKMMDQGLEYQRAETGEYQKRTHTALFTALVDDLITGNYAPDEIMDMLNTQGLTELKKLADLTGASEEEIQNDLNATKAKVAIAKYEAAIKTGDIRSADKIEAKFGEYITDNKMAELKDKRNDTEIILSAESYAESRMGHSRADVKAGAKQEAENRYPKNQVSQKKFIDEAMKYYDIGAKEAERAAQENQAAVVTDAYFAIMNASDKREAVEIYRNLPPEIQKKVEKAYNDKLEDKVPVLDGHHLLDIQENIDKGLITTDAQIQQEIGIIGEAGVKYLIDYRNKGRNSPAGFFDMEFRRLNGDRASAKKDIDGYDEAQRRFIEEVYARGIGNDEEKMKALIIELSLDRRKERWGIIPDTKATTAVAAGREDADKFLIDDTPKNRELAWSGLLMNEKQVYLQRTGGNEEEAKKLALEAWQQWELEDIAQREANEKYNQGTK